MWTTTTGARLGPGTSVAVANDISSLGAPLPSSLIALTENRCVEPGTSSVIAYCGRLPSLGASTCVSTPSTRSMYPLIASPLPNGGAQTTLKAVAFDRPSIIDRDTGCPRSGTPRVLCVPGALTLPLLPMALSASTASV